MVSVAWLMGGKEAAIRAAPAIRSDTSRRFSMVVND
jgi:hypothetical protein